MRIRRSRSTAPDWRWRCWGRRIAQRFGHTGRSAGQTNCCPVGFGASPGDWGHPLRWPFHRLRRRNLGPAPPKRFAIDALGRCFDDVDREIDDAAIARLAFFSGQSEEHLLRGTMRADAPIRSTDFRERVQRALLRHGDLVLNRSRRGRSVPVIQYCPVCLGGDDTAYLRRGWRFSVEIVCHRDGCLLLDSCWRCGALLNPLAQTVPSSEFLCVKCGVPFARAPSLCLGETIRDQMLVYHQLERLAFSISPDVIGILAEEYIDELSASDLRGTNPANPADRHNAITAEGWRLYGAWEQARAARAAERRAPRPSVARPPRNPRPRWLIPVLRRADRGSPRCGPRV